jgi:hypothetical protein
VVNFVARDLLSARGFIGFAVVVVVIIIDQTKRRIPGCYFLSMPASLSVGRFSRFLGGSEVDPPIHPSFSTASTHFGQAASRFVAPQNDH